MHNIRLCVEAYGRIPPDFSSWITRRAHYCKQRDVSELLPQFDSTVDGFGGSVSTEFIVVGVEEHLHKIPATNHAHDIGSLG